MKNIQPDSTTSLNLSQHIDSQILPSKDEFEKIACVEKRTPQSSQTTQLTKSSQTIQPQYAKHIFARVGLALLISLLATFITIIAMSHGPIMTIIMLLFSDTATSILLIGTTMLTMLTGVFNGILAAKKSAVLKGQQSQLNSMVASLQDALTNENEMQQSIKIDESEKHVESNTQTSTRITQPSKPSHLNQYGETYFSVVCILVVYTFIGIALCGSIPLDLIFLAPIIMYMTTFCNFVMLIHHNNEQNKLKKEQSPEPVNDAKGKDRSGIESQKIEQKVGKDIDEPESTESNIKQDDEQNKNLQHDPSHSNDEIEDKEAAKKDAN